MADGVAQAGYAVVETAISGAAVTQLVAAVEAAANGAELGTHQRGGSVYALRNLLETIPAVAQFAASESLRHLVTPILGPGAFPVRGIWFDKTPGANWRVGWHQDLAIAVRERRDVAGFGAWSGKDGVPHVQPPDFILEQMLTVRLHCDDCDETNGCLRVLPGSHRQGRLDAEGVAAWRSEHQSAAVPVRRGGVLLMRPLLLHASSPAQVPGHRRVLHIEYAAQTLPGGLQWRTEFVRVVGGEEP